MTAPSFIKLLLISTNGPSWDRYRMSRMKPNIIGEESSLRRRRLASFVELLQQVSPMACTGGLCQRNMGRMQQAATWDLHPLSHFVPLLLVGVIVEAAR